MWRWTLVKELAQDQERQAPGDDADQGRLNVSQLRMLDFSSKPAGLLAFHGRTLAPITSSGPNPGTR